METVTRDPNLPDITIAIDSTPYRMDLIYRTARTYAPPTQAEKNDYYKAYDPMIGLRIAATLSGFFILAVLYVVYKVSSCSALIYQRRRAVATCCPRSHRVSHDFIARHKFSITPS